MGAGKSTLINSLLAVEGETFGFDASSYFLKARKSKEAVTREPEGVVTPYSIYIDTCGFNDPSEK